MDQFGGNPKKMLNSGEFGEFVFSKSAKILPFFHTPVFWSLNLFSAVSRVNKQAKL